MGFISGALRPRLLLVVSLMVAAHVLTVSPHSCFAGRSTSTTAAGRSSVSLRLVHRDAPCSELKSPSVEASRQSLPDGMPLKELLVKGRAMRERERALRGKMPSKKRAGSAAAATFSYLGLSPGEFYTTLPVGNPPQKLIFIMDTGSELAWTQCKPCSRCTGKGPSFDFQRSATYLPVPCDSRLCAVFKGQCAANESYCPFGFVYGDGSQAGGNLFVDDLWIGGEEGGKIPALEMRRRLVLGCAVLNQDIAPLPNSGTAGLSPGPFSLASQLLHGAHRKRMAYCIPDLLTAGNATGPILFGDYKYPRPAPHLRYTRLVPPYSPLGDLYYYVGLSGISVGQSRLNIPSRYLAGSKSGEGGSIFDSGTAITHLRRPIYDALVKAMASQTAHLRPFITSERDLCYNISADAADLPRVPSITFHLLGGVDMELDSHSVLFPEDMVGDVLVVCLAFAGDLGGSSINIIGNYQHQNYWVEYDLDNSRLGIAKADCAKF